jgi:hypothetical protein
MQNPQRSSASVLWLSEETDWVSAIPRDCDIGYVVAWNPQVSGTTRTLLGVEYWSGQYVAVGEQGVILTSLDGAIWNSRNSGTSNALVNVAGGPGAVVAVGFAGTVVTSTNGIVWNSQRIGPSISYIFGIAYGNGRFVAGEVSGLVWTSADGID